MPYTDFVLRSAAVYFLGVVLRMVRLLTRYVVKHHVWIAAILGVLTIGMATKLFDLRINTSSYVLPADHPSRVNFANLKKHFTGSNDAFLIVLESPDTIFKHSTLKRIQELTAAFETINILSPKDYQDLEARTLHLAPSLKEQVQEFITLPKDVDSWESLEELREAVTGQDGSPELAQFFDLLAVKLNPLIKVSSLSNSDNIKGNGDELDTSPIFKEAPSTAEGIARVRSDALENELFRGTLVTSDERHTIFALELNIDADDSNSQDIFLKKVKHLLDQEIPGEEKYYIAGFPVVSTLISKTVEKDSMKLFPIVLALVILCLCLTFRTAIGVFVPLTVVTCSLIWTMGAMAYFDIPMDVISVAMPVFILSIGVADGIHMYAEYREHRRRGLSNHDAVSETLHDITKPIFVTSITTSMAFIILSMTDISQLKYFGQLVAFGTMVAFMFSIFLIPSLLLSFPQQNLGTSSEKTNKVSFLDTILFKLSDLAIHRSKTVLTVAGVLGCVALFGFSKVRVDNNPINFFQDDSDIVLATQKLDDKISGSIYFNVLVRSNSDEPQPMRNPRNLRAVASLTEHLSQQPLVGKSISLADLIKRIHLVLNDNDPAYHSVPKSKEIIRGQEVKGRHVISQYLMMYGNGGKASIRDLLNPNNTEINLKVILRTNSSYELSKIKTMILDYAAKNFPPELETRITGRADINVATTEEIISGQVGSFGVSMVLSIILLSVIFRSISKGILGIVPLFYTIMVNFAIMGFFGIDLNIGTAVISSVVIGIGVDYSIHYLERMGVALDHGMSFNDAVSETVNFSGKAIASNAVTVGTGFLTLMVSDFKPLFTMGWMIFISMTLSAICTLVIIPATMRLYYKKSNETQNLNHHLSTVEMEPNIANG